MPLVVARHEDHRKAGDLADARRGGRLAPRACDARLADVLEPRKLIDAGAADDAEHRLGHAVDPLPGARRPQLSKKRDFQKTKGPERGPSSSGFPRSGVAAGRHRAPYLLLGEVQQAGEHDQEDHDLEADALARLVMWRGGPLPESRN